MKRQLISMIAALMAALMLLCAVSCETDGGDADTTPADVAANVTPAETTTAAPQLKEFTFSSNYVVVRPEDGDDLEIEALTLFMRGVRSAYGVNLKAGDDFVRKGAEVVPGEYEILIGATNRTQSVELSESLSYYDWDYKVVSENVIVICGGSPAATLEATRAFLRDVIGYTEDDDQKPTAAGTAVALSADIADSYRYDYGDVNLMIGQRKAEEYTIVASSNNTHAAKLIAADINRMTGKSLNIVEPSAFEGGPAIYFGCSGKDGAHLDRTPYGTSRYYITVVGEDIVIDFKASTAAKYVATYFVRNVLSAGGDILAGLKEAERSGVYVNNGTNELLLDSSTDSEVAPGIVYTKQLYYDPAGKPVRAYILTVEAGAGVLYTSMPSDGMTVGKVQNIPAQMKAAAQNGKKVLAGINADFFDMGGTNVMRGLCIKDGIELTGPGGRPWFGVTAEGTPVIGTSDEYAARKGTLVTAVGGSHVLLKNDTVRDIAVGTEFADTRHPRTAIGFKPDGSLVIMVVDGRQSSISNGASLADLAEMFGSLGCSDAINLDGGGSSTFVIAENGEFVTKNSPSAGALRAVANGLIVLAP